MSEPTFDPAVGEPVVDVSLSPEVPAEPVGESGMETVVVPEGSVVEPVADPEVDYVHEPEGDVAEVTPADWTDAQKNLAAGLGGGVTDGGPTPHEQVEAVEKTGDPIVDHAATGQNTVSAALAATAADEALTAGLLEREAASAPAVEPAATLADVVNAEPVPDLEPVAEPVVDAVPEPEATP